MAKIIRQEFGKSWAFYNGDCVYVMAGIPDESIDFGCDSPPFAQLYIYSDSIADLGNSSDEKEFFDGYRFVLRELNRISKTGSYRGIHCKDLMRYMNNHGYSGQDDFPGHIIKLAEEEGWTFQRWITVWKNPVVEMQRTKTYGLLHKSFQERAEVVRQGAPDYVLVLRKQSEQGEYAENTQLPVLPESVKERIKHIWALPDDGPNQIGIYSLPLEKYNNNFIDILSKKIDPGRLCFAHCAMLPRIHNGVEVGKFNMMGEIIERFEAQGSWKFHTRIALTDGTYLIGFRNWTDELRRNYKELNGQVKHNLTAPKNVAKHEIIRYYKDVYNVFAGSEVLQYSDETDYDVSDTYIEYQDQEGTYHHDYIGNDPPRNWHDDGYYSILVWQKYASPVWYDLDGLPDSHKDAWMNIEQTNVLNFKAAKTPEDQKHICPLQLDLIEKLILEYSNSSDIFFTPYGGIGSEGYQAVKLGRKAVLAELKPNYWQQGCRYLREAEKESLQIGIMETV